MVPIFGWQSAKKATVEDVLVGEADATQGADALATMAGNVDYCVEDEKDNGRESLGGIWREWGGACHTGSSECKVG